MVAVPLWSDRNVACRAESIRSHPRGSGEQTAPASRRPPITKPLGEPRTRQRGGRSASRSIPSLLERLASRKPLAGLYTARATTIRGPPGAQHRDRATWEGIGQPVGRAARLAEEGDRSLGERQQGGACISPSRPQPCGAGPQRIGRLNGKKYLKPWLAGAMSGRCKVPALPPPQIVKPSPVISSTAVFRPAYAPHDDCSRARASSPGWF